jgi:hypothetical protein
MIMKSLDEDHLKLREKLEKRLKGKFADLGLPKN